MIQKSKNYQFNIKLSMYFFGKGIPLFFPTLIKTECDLFNTNSICRIFRPCSVLKIFKIFKFHFIVLLHPFIGTPHN